VNRRTSSGAPFNPGEAVTAEQALRAYTFGSAHASRAEHRKGTITPGKLADPVVLSGDPTEVRPKASAEIEVLATFADGQCRYDIRDGLVTRP
jgi:predicted amidohydrolase YtcJ